jgi:hypothetical protein
MHFSRFCLTDFRKVVDSYKITGMLKSAFVILVLLISSIAVNAQRHSGLRGFFKMKEKPAFLRKTPALALSPQQDLTYWQGASYVNYSENGRLKTTMSFDAQGMLRDSFSSINLKKDGVFSYWRIQISAQRTRPMFVYTIH